MSQQCMCVTWGLLRQSLSMHCHTSSSVSIRRNRNELRTELSSFLLRSLALSQSLALPAIASQLLLLFSIVYSNRCAVSNFKYIFALTASCLRQHFGMLKFTSACVMIVSEIEQLRELFAVLWSGDCTHQKRCTQPLRCVIFTTTLENVWKDWWPKWSFKSKVYGIIFDLWIDCCSEFD